MLSVKLPRSQKASKLAESVAYGAAGDWKLHPLVSASELAKLVAWSMC